MGVVVVVLVSETKAPSAGDNRATGKLKRSAPRTSSTATDGAPTDRKMTLTLTRPARSPSSLSLSFSFSPFFFSVSSAFALLLSWYGWR